MLEVKDFYKPERAFLVGVCLKSEDRERYDYSIQELIQLSKTAGIEVVDIFIQPLEKPDSATHIGSGKLKEIINKVSENDITTLIFNGNLSSSQAKNIAKETRCNIVDRTELILDIFAKHAKTYESRLQVELAQLEYSYSKLRNLWQHFSRIAGGVGVGVRGPGEKQIEIDRRAVRKRISILKDKLEEVKKSTEIKRKKRSNHLSICLVGYTNAGKSTLFNLLTKESIYTADELFATLDSTTRNFNLEVKKDLILTDTIGFIDNLPPTLIQSFYSTLFEVRHADLLLHVIDISNPDFNKHIDTVNHILQDMGVIEQNILHVFNKCDLFKSVHNKFVIKDLSNTYSDSVFISTKTGENVDKLKQKISHFLDKDKILKKIYVPDNLIKIISYIHEHTEVQKVKYDQKTKVYEFETLIEKKIDKNIQEQLDKTKLINFINS